LKPEIQNIYTLFLDTISYSSKTRLLTVNVIEGFVSSETESIEISEGNVMDNVRSIDILDKSRKFKVEFDSPIAWQNVDESFTAFDKAEIINNKGVIQEIKNSEYLKYVRENHGWFEPHQGTAIQYRIWTENDVVDIVTTEEPQIVQVK
tara:strand:- start:2159 stop:2605 length:447 start_codon:yes stop_codon:yes gene_type:complete